MDNVRIGVIGLGNMGQYHVKYLREGAVNGCTLTAASDAVHSRTEALAAAATPHDRELLTRQITATDAAIDRLVYELYDLTPEEIALVEAGA